MHRVSHRTRSRGRRRRRRRRQPQATHRSRRRRMSREAVEANTKTRRSGGNERSPSNEEKSAVTFPGVVVTQVEVARAYSAAPRRATMTFEGKVSAVSFIDDDALCPYHVSTVSSRLPPPSGGNRGGVSIAGEATKDNVVVAAGAGLSISRCASWSRGHSGQLLSTLGNCNVRVCFSFCVNFERTILHPFFVRDHPPAGSAKSI